jgi:hypothetical protein
MVWAVYSRTYPLATELLTMDQLKTKKIKVVGPFFLVLLKTAVLPAAIIAAVQYLLYLTNAVDRKGEAGYDIIWFSAIIPILLVWQMHKLKKKILEQNENKTNQTQSEN